MTLYIKIDNTNRIKYVTEKNYNNIEYIEVDSSIFEEVFGKLPANNYNNLIKNSEYYLINNKLDQRIYVQVDEKDIIRSIGYLKMDGFIPTDIYLNEFIELYRNISVTDGRFKLYNNHIVENTSFTINDISPYIIDSLRSQRDSDCFSVINRGELWYSRLTEAQKKELAEWYDAWLDVTETLEIPEKPTWL